MTASIEPMYVADSEAEWIDFAELGDLSPVAPATGKGETKRLWAIPEENRVFAMMRMWPGMVSRRHLHRGPVTVYTVSGRWHYLEYDWIAEPGSFVYEPTGAIHTLEVLGDEPAIIYVDNTGNTVNYTDDGGVLDAKNDEDYQAAVEADRLYQAARI
jgi:2,4'-dihydroxyacetophenone dioxygenase